MSDPYRELADAERRANAAGRRADQARLLKKMAVAAEDCGDDALRAEVQCRTAEWALRSGRFSAGVEAANVAVALAERLRREDLAAAALRSGGMCLHYLGRSEDALEWERHAAERSERLGDTFGRLTALSNTAVISLRLGLPEVAQSYLDEAVTQWREMGRKEGLAGPLNNMSMVCHRLGDLTQALEIQLEAVELAALDGNVDLEAHVLASLGIIYRSYGRPGLALDAFTRAAALGREAADRKIESYAQMWRGRILLAQGQLTDARTAIELAVKRSKNMNAPLNHADILEALAELQLAEARPGSARETLRSVQDLRDGRRDPTLNLLFARAERDLGHDPESRAYLSALAAEKDTPTEGALEVRDWWCAASLAADVGEHQLARDFCARGDAELARRGLDIGLGDDRRRFEEDARRGRPTFDA